MRLITYLSPSIPAALFETIARHIGADLVFEETISGPQPGDDEPFTRGDADIGFVCAPSYRVLRDSVELLPALVPSDPRANGQPVYFAEVVVRNESRIHSFDELRGARWAYNDRNSRSGWFSMLERAGSAGFFGELLHAGSHLHSLEFVSDGRADAAAIDSNVRALHSHEELRVLESWGPFPIQPSVIRRGLPADEKQRIVSALLSIKSEELLPHGFSGFAHVTESAYL